MRKLRILALMHEDLVPPDDLNGRDPRQIEQWKMEYDVCSTLQELGHDVLKLGVGDELRPIRLALGAFKPHITFNLLEEFRGEALYDWSVVAYLELLRQRYTGCNPRGLMLARDKALSKKILAWHRIKVPDFAVFALGRRVRRPPRLRFPLFVKSLIEEASLGISQASLVDSDEKLEERVRFVHESLGTDAIAESYIEGRELYVGVLGNRRLRVLPTWELRFNNLPEGAPRIATAKVKWDKSYQKKIGVDTQFAELYEDDDARLVKLCKRIYRALGLSGYARLDFRMNDQGEFYLLEANPNPQIALNEDFAESAWVEDIEYPQLIQRIVNIGLRSGHR
jgi:D-alanine-D-alanine ligase